MTKKGPEVKLPIWILITKSRGLPWFTWHGSFKSCWQGLLLCFRPHLNWRFAQEIMSFQSRRSSNFGNFGIPNMRILGQNDVWLLAPWLGIENTIRGKVVVSPSPNHGESCEFVFVRGSSVHQKCSNYALTNLLFGLCKSMWVI